MEQELGNDFLSWFGGDRKRLEDFRRRLVYWFGKQSCKTEDDCEENAQKTFLRVMQILARKPTISAIPPEQYIIGVAKNILRERPIKLPVEGPDPETIPDPDSDPDSELERECERICLEKCLQNLKAEERELVELYAQSNSHYTEELAKKFGGTPNALRLRIFRTIREKLKPCVESCLDSGQN